MSTEPKALFSVDTENAPIGVQVLHPSVLKPLAIRERKPLRWALGVADILCLQLALALAHTLRVALSTIWPISVSNHTYRTLQVAVLLTPAACWLAGLYPGYGMAAVERLRRRVIAITCVFGALVAWDTFMQHGEWPRGIILATFFIALVLSPLFEAVFISILVRLRVWGKPVVILSAERAGSALARILRSRAELGLIPAAIFTRQAEFWGSEVDGTRVIGPPALATHYAGQASTAVVAMPGLNRSDLARIVESLPFRRVIVIPELAGLPSLWVNARDLGGTLALDLQKNLLRRRQFLFKRSLDYALGIPLLLFTAPLIAILAVWIKRVSPGPAFYSQEREGQHGKTIRIWKLRTMYPDAEATLETYLNENPDERTEWERFYKLKHDPRILPGVGRLLRKTSLDELPQLWNVLRGELSLVGPRPFPLYHMECFGDDFRRLRSSVLPGVTGYWQISARSDGDIEVQQQLDTYYIRNWSPWLDAYILARTVAVVLLGEGAY